MQAFCRIVERGSFTRAAEDLGVSPALLSRDVRRLEASLGCVLLQRTTRSMSLTEQGRLYYEQTRRILQEIVEVEAHVLQQTGQVRGQLRVNAPQSFAQTVLSPLLPAFLARYPELTLTLACDDRVVDMIEGGFDVSIRIRPSLPDSVLVARRLAPVRQLLFASPAYLERAGTPSAPAELAEHRLVSYLLAEDTARWSLSSGEQTTDVPLTAHLAVGSSLVLRDMLVAGLGIGALPDFLGGPAEASGELRQVLPGYELPMRHIYVLTASRRLSDGKTLAFLDFLKTTLGRG